MGQDAWISKCKQFRKNVVQRWKRTYVILSHSLLTQKHYFQLLFNNTISPKNNLERMKTNSQEHAWSTKPCSRNILPRYLSRYCIKNARYSKSDLESRSPAHVYITNFVQLVHQQFDGFLLGLFGVLKCFSLKHLYLTWFLEQISELFYCIKRYSIP